MKPNFARDTQFEIFLLRKGTEKKKAPSRRVARRSFQLESTNAEEKIPKMLTGRLFIPFALTLFVTRFVTLIPLITLSPTVLGVARV